MPAAGQTVQVRSPDKNLAVTILKMETVRPTEVTALA